MERATRYAPDVLRTFLDWLLPRHAAVGGVTEIRILGGDAGVWSALVGPGDAEALVAALAPVSATPRRSIPRGDHPRSGEASIYFSLQAVQPSADRRTGLPLRRASRTTKDRDVRAYSIVVVDVDPERLPKDRSATDSEKEEARVVAEAVRGWLSDLGVPSMLADSGNGWHVLVPLVPATGDDVAQAARDTQRLLTLLDARFSTAGAKVDRSTFNPSRILKLYGTAAVKGEDTPEHPHRVSSIDLGCIPEDTDLSARLAEADLGELVAPRTPTPPARRSPASPADLSPTWTAWRAEALARFPLEAVYGAFLTGRASAAGWLQCRDPWAANGDRHPSAGVADGAGEAERGTFHSFIRSESLSVFDFLVRRGDAPDFRAACARVAELAGVPLPRADASELVAAFRAAWSVASSQDERTGALRAVL
ncbi:MAG: hypothetical protein ACK4YP_14490, partial [Myxococcota bacterium]